MSKYVAVLLALALSAPTSAENYAVVVEVQAVDLADNAFSLIGKKVRVTGCVSVHQHGMQVHPCGPHHWRQITLLSDPDRQVIPALRELGFPPAVEVPIEIYGILFIRHSTKPNERDVPVLRVQSVRKVDRLGPNNSFKPTPLRGAA